LIQAYDAKHSPCPPTYQERHTLIGTYWVGSGV